MFYNGLLKGPNDTFPQVLLAEILLSGEGDTVLGVQALAGAFGMVGE